MMDKPKLLDIGCGGGGAGAGYAEYFDVTGLDIEPQPRYPFRFLQGDMLTFPLDGMESFAALVDWLEADTNQFFESPLYEGNSLIDVWTGLYLALEQLEVPKELIDALIVIIRLITAKKGSTA